MGEHVTILPPPPIDPVMAIKVFLHALDNGWFGSDLTRQDLSDTAAIDNLRHAVAHVEQRS